jgi:hypothetical protein
MVTTLDYTYSENKIQTKRNDSRPGSTSARRAPGPKVRCPARWCTPKSSPAVSDIAMGGANFATKTENKSLGFNAVWKVNNDLRLEFDGHNSTAESMADSPYGSSNTLGTASFSRGNTSADFSQDFPVLSIQGADFRCAAAGDRLGVRQRLHEGRSRPGAGQGPLEDAGILAAELRPVDHQGQQPLRLLQPAARHLGRRHQGVGLPEQHVPS